MKPKLRLAFAVPAFSLVVLGAQADLIVNGGFENGGFGGWTLSGSSVETFVDGAIPGVGAPHSGNYQAFLGTVGSLEELSQTVDTIFGGNYHIDFWVSDAVAYTGSEFLVKWGGTTLLDLVNPPKSPYTEYSFDVTGDGSPTTLQFGFQHDASFFLLDDVSVTGPVSHVPELGSWEMEALTTCALTIFGVVVRRARK